METFYVDSALRIFQQQFKSINNFIFTYVQLSSRDYCAEGFQSADEEAAKAGDAAEGEEHLQGVGASADEELPRRRHVALAPRTCPDPLRKHASYLS